MEKIHFYNTNTIYEGVTDFVKKNVLVINFKDVVPTVEEMTNGFEILNENNDFVQAEIQIFPSPVLHGPHHRRISDLKS